MPASTLDPVNAALRSSLTKNESNSYLNCQLIGPRKKVLLSNVEFEPAGSYQSTVLEKLKLKYIILKNTPTPKPSSSPEENMSSDETLKAAKCELYPLEAVQLGWKNCDWSVGAGMVNMGNTCYLNSTLQALFHVPALANWLLSDKEHATECQGVGVPCIICAMRKTLMESQRNSNSIRPILIYNKLRIVCRNLIPGRQEDAHEFLRYLVEAMEKAYLNRFENHSEFDSRTKETTPLNQILGGYLRSAVRCLECGHVSTTFQHFQDLLLDIRKAQTLDEALEGYFSREKLDDESYRCESCKKKVQATKQFSLERTPMVLCIQLKRFSVTNNKITKHVIFRQRLDLARYVRHRPSAPLVYRLVALVTHMGPTVGCGHYTAVAQTPSGNFYQFDDSMVRPISHQTVFNTNAYIMLYELESPPFSQKSINASNKMKFQTTSTIESEEYSTTGTIKPFINGITSSKPYRPELPPDKLFNGSISSSMSNGNAKIPYSFSTNSDIRDSGNGKIQKENQIPLSIKYLCTSTNEKSKLKYTFTPKQLNSISSSNHQANSSLPCLTKESVSSSRESPSSVTSYSQPITRLVPYETDDSTNSEDSNYSQQVDSRVSTTTALDGEWQVTSSSNVTQEPSSSENGKCWEKKSNHSINELFQMSHSGYSAPVLSWNGTRAQLDKETLNERREERKRPLFDNEDQGKIKHQKLSNNFKSNPGYNPIQEYHTSKNNWNQNNGCHYKQFYNTGNRHRRNFHHKNYHKNYRCGQ